MLIRMHVKKLILDSTNQNPILVLRSVETGQDLQIWIGQPEANAIIQELESYLPARPMTHDLMKNILDELDVNVTRIIISALRNETFFAIIEMSIGDETLEIDARPSDAIALGLRVEAPIFVEEDVLNTIEKERAGLPAPLVDVEEGEDDNEPDTETESWEDTSALKDWLDNISPDDFTKE